MFNYGESTNCDIKCQLTVINHNLAIFEHSGDEIQTGLKIITLITALE